MHDLGQETLEGFLQKYPAEPYLKLAERLGQDVAGLQLIWMQYIEAKERGGIRNAAKDSLAREIRRWLRRGWGKGIRPEFNSAGAYAFWVNELERIAPDYRPRAEAVWQVLEEIPPPDGWLPTGPSDPIIVSAFDKGWPEN